jgi:ureidoglycolate lyase
MAVDQWQQLCGLGNKPAVILRLQPLTRISFARYGQVLDFAPGDEPRRNFAAELSNARAAARPNLRIQRTEPTLLPLTIKVIERHHHSSQLFAPLSGSPYLVVVFPSDALGSPVLTEGCAFCASGDQAINYNPVTWHHGFMALERPGTFLMLRWEDGSSGDEEFVDLEPPIRICG